MLHNLFSLLSSFTIYFFEFFVLIFALFFSIPASNPVYLSNISLLSEELTNSFIDASIINKQIVAQAVAQTDRNFHLFSNGRSSELFAHGVGLDAEGISNFTNYQFSIVNIFGCNLAKDTNCLASESYIENELG